MPKNGDTHRNELFVELIRLLKIPVIALTTVLVVLILGIDPTAIEISYGGIGFRSSSARDAPDPVDVGGSTSQQDNVEPANTPLPLPTATGQVQTPTPQASNRTLNQLTGWVYLGTFRNKNWTEQFLDVSAGTLPKPPVQLKVTADNLNVREDRPKWPLYRMANVVNVLSQGDLVTVDEVVSNVGKGRVWARVSY